MNDAALVVVEVRGGTVVATYANSENVRILLVDWDESEAGGEPGFTFPLDRLDDMPADTLAVVNRVLGDSRLRIPAAKHS